MGQYGLKIKNIESSTLYETNLGIRDHFEYKDSMFTNSLLFDFLIDNGMKKWRENFTRDIICLEFNWGTRSYQEELDRLEKTKKKYVELEIQDSINKVDLLIEKTKSNKDTYNKLSKEDLRDYYYKYGCDVTYNTRNKDGDIVNSETIHYKMLYRSTGKAKKGSCMFICDDLYDTTKNFIQMGIELPEKDAKIVEMSAYAPLISSTIVGKVKIEPKNILVVKDVDCFMETNVVSIEIDDEKKCIAKKIDNYKLKNTIFDGQGLIDASIFPNWADGCILLRHHMCKVESFCSNIQLFMQDYFGDRYETAKIMDMFGNEHYAKDILFITTENAVKWTKFNVSYEYWCEKISENGSYFGIVKTTHESKLGDVQRMSYQMVNSLDLDIMNSVSQKSVEYINKLKTDDKEFIKYLYKNANFSNDYVVLAEIAKKIPLFTTSEYFRTRKWKIIQKYTDDFKSGRVIQNGDNLVLVGSPYAMLLHAVGESVYKDDTFETMDGCVQCYSNRFDEGDFLAGFRSPHNAKNNVMCLYNTHSDKMCRYFNFGTLVIAVNCIGTDLQDRLNGADFDGDSMYVTNHPSIVLHSKHCYRNYPTIVNNIPKSNKTYDNAIENYSLIDNKLSASQTIIGETSNLAQLALTYSYNFEDRKYDDYVCILSVLAQVAIDVSKRSFDIDLTSEVARIKSDMNIKENGFPSFWMNIKPQFNRKRVNKKLLCPMNYLGEIRLSKPRSQLPTIATSSFLKKTNHFGKKKKNERVEELIKKYSFDLRSSGYTKDKDMFNLMSDEYENLINDIRQIYISKNYQDLMMHLLYMIFEKDVDNNLSKNKSILLKVLYDISPKVLLDCFE